LCPLCTPCKSSSLASSLFTLPDSHR
jgi:hypothetical protein